MSEEQTPQEPVEETPTPQEPVEAPQEPTTKTYLNDDGTFNRDAFGDELGKHSIFDKYKNIEELVKGTINTQKLVGKKAEDFWTSEDPNDIALRQKIMGVPQDASEYTFELPEDADVDEERLESFKAFAKDELGLTKEQAQKILEWDLDGVKALNEAYAQEQEQAMRSAEEALRKEWKGDKFKYNVEKAKDTLSYLGMDDYIDDPAYGNNPDFIRAVVEKIVPLIDNDTIIESRQGQSFASIDDTLRDLENKMFNYQGDTNSSDYKNLVQQRADLLAKLKKS
jgi:hypothetical protein